MQQVDQGQQRSAGPVLSRAIGRSGIGEIRLVVNLFNQPGHGLEGSAEVAEQLRGVRVVVDYLHSKSQVRALILLPQILMKIV